MTIKKINNTNDEYYIRCDKCQLEGIIRASFNEEVAEKEILNTILIKLGWWPMILSDTKRNDTCNLCIQDGVNLFKETYV